jgi:hypothetical protein
MGFLRRLTGREGRDAPEWCASLGGDGYHLMVEIVARQLGSRDMPGPPSEVWWQREPAETLDLPRLAARLAQTPRRDWEAIVRRYYGPMIAQREAGDRVEAAAASLELATPFLRLVLMREESAPPGDVRFPGPLPGTVEVLALDTKVSDRFVSEGLAASWGEPLETIRAVAEAEVLKLPIEEADQTHVGRPAVRSYSLERQGAYIGPVIQHLAERLPDAVGPFGAYVAVPAPGAIIVRPLAAGIDVRGDLREVAILCQTVWGKAARRIDQVPFWVRPDGKIVPGPLRFDDVGAAGSSMPGLDGVLTALDPRELLPVAGWAQGKFSPEQYTRFAGCVSAELGYATPEQVAMLGSGLGLSRLAEACSAAPFETWPDQIREHIHKENAVRSGVETLASGRTDDHETAVAALVTWLAGSAPDPSAVVSQRVGETGFVEILGMMANDIARPVQPGAVSALGPLDALFARGRQAIRKSLSAAPSQTAHLSGSSVRVTGHPSPTAAIPHLMAWLPDAVGPYGALVAVGNAWSLEVLPIHDASVVLDLPELLGAAAGASAMAEWPVTPSVFWLRPDGLDVLRIEVADGLIVGLSLSADLTGIVARLPAGPRQLPPGLEEVLGSDGSRRLLGLVQAAVLDRLASDPAGLAGLELPDVRGLGARCRPRPPTEWPTEIRTYLDEMAAPRHELDRLTRATDYSMVEPALSLRVARRERTGSALARDVGGDLAVYPVIGSAGRYRRVTHAMLEHWRVDPDRCHQDAATRTAFAADLIDEPMFPDQPSVRQVYCRETEREAAGLYLHLRYPETRRGFVVSITHGSRAHYIRLDDPGAPSLIPTFARVIAEIYRNADAAADAHSPWLLWLAPDGRLVELLDTTAPMPPPERLPVEFRALLSEGGPPRVN